MFSKEYSSTHQNLLHAFEEALFRIVPLLSQRQQHHVYVIHTKSSVQNEKKNSIRCKQFVLRRKGKARNQVCAPTIVHLQHQERQNPSYCQVDLR